MKFWLSERERDGERESLTKKQPAHILMNAWNRI